MPKNKIRKKRSPDNMDKKFSKNDLRMGKFKIGFLFVIVLGISFFVLAKMTG